MPLDVLSSFATILNRLQNSSPWFWPRRGKNASSFSPLRMGVLGQNFTSRCVLAALAGRMNAGAMGVMGSWSSCGVCGKCGDTGDAWRSTSVSGFGNACDISGVVGERTRLSGVATASGRERLSAATGAA